MGRGIVDMVAIVFPGQGSQSLRMLSAYTGLPAVGEAVDEASDAIGVDLVQIIENDEAALNQTVNTQPAMLAIGVGVYRAVVAALPRIQTFAGHSLGEYAALVCTGSVSLADAAVLVRLRAEYMQAAVVDGGMLAVLGATIDAVEAVCTRLRTDGEKVWVANVNTDNQIVLAGLASSLQAAETAVKQEAGAKRAVRLPMSVPSHCPLLSEAAQCYESALRNANWSAATIPVEHNADVSISSGDAGEFFCAALSAQLVQPVRWTQTLDRFAERGVTRVYECGPGKVLTNLGKKSSLAHIALNDAAAVTSVLNEEV